MGMDKIVQYQGNIFTHDGQCPGPDQFPFKPVISALKAVKPKLTVIYGYHGDKSGNWIRNFTINERKRVVEIIKEQKFTNAELELRVQPGLCDMEIRNEVARRNVLFTWCDSDKRVKKVMGGKMPKKV